VTLNAWRAAGSTFAWRGHEIFARVHGTGDVAYVCVHGFPTASFDWAPLWPALTAQHAHVVTLDMLGFGFSSKPRGHAYSLMEQMDLHEAFLASRGVTQVHLLAHDYGVSVAQEWLARNLEGRAPTLRTVTLLNGGLFPETHRPTMTQRLLLSPLGPLVSRLMNEERFAKAFSIVFGPSTKPTRDELHDFWRLVAHNQGHRIAHALIRYIPERRANRARWVGALTSTQVPLRLINGPEDPVSGAHMVARYREVVPNADVVLLPGIGHYPQVEAPDEVLRALLPARVVD
jgi:pimeloyl-ACP methyl ester carboxylesterase